MISVASSSRSAVADVGAQPDGARHEGAAAARDLPSTIILERALGEIEALRARDDATARDHFALGHRTGEVEIERDGEHEDVLDDRVRGKEGRVVERLEVHGPVRRMRGMVEAGPGD